MHRKPYSALHPIIDDTLKETYGIPVYQEDISRIAIAIAGLSPERADQLRKICSRKDRHAQLPVFKNQFFKGGAARGVEKSVLVEVWKMIISFGGYSFCKAHSASYALVSYKLAYLKRHYPLDFMVSVVNNGGGFYSCQTYFNETRRMGFRLLGPDINRSHMRHAPEAEGIRIGFCGLRELSGKFALSVLRGRASGGRYRSFVDFVARCSPGLPEMRILIRSGTLDCLSDGQSRPALFWLFSQTSKYQGQFFLPPVPEFISDYSSNDKLLDQVRTLGMLISEHPIAVFNDRIEAALRCTDQHPFIGSDEMAQYKGRSVILAGLLVTAKEVITKKSEQMTFVSFEDRHSIFETVLFPDTFKRFYFHLDRVAVFLVTGTVVYELGSYIVQVEKLVKISSQQPQQQKQTGHWNPTVSKGPTRRLSTGRQR